jgi:hypothetical protein
MKNWLKALQKVWVVVLFSDCALLSFPDLGKENVLKRIFGCGRRFCPAILRKWIPVFICWVYGAENLGQLNR